MVLCQQWLEGPVNASLVPRGRPETYTNVMCTFKRQAMTMVSAILALNPTLLCKH